jgi:hypothetical protein
MSPFKCAVACLALAFLAALSFSQTPAPAPGAAPARDSAADPTIDQVVFQQGLSNYQGCEDVATDGDQAEVNLLEDRSERGLGLFGDPSGNWAFLRFNDLKAPPGRKLAKAELVLTITEHGTTEKSGLAAHRLTRKLDFAQISFAYRDLGKKEKWGTTQPADKGEEVRGFPKAGVEYLEKPEAVVSASAEKPQLVIDLTAAVRDWLADPAKNTGLVLRPLTDESVGWVASSKQEQADRPKLVLHLVPEKP